MIHNSNNCLILHLIRISFVLVVFVLFGAIMGANSIVQAQKTKPRAASSFSESTVAQQATYGAYKGVRIGMTTNETRTILGTPTDAGDDQDFWVVTSSETAQVFYDKSHKVTAISVDYVGDNGGAPNYKDVVGANIDVKPDGSMYKMVRYDQLGFWVSYNRTVATIAIISITIKKL